MSLGHNYDNSDYDEHYHETLDTENRWYMDLLASSVVIGALVGLNLSRNGSSLETLLDVGGGALAGVSIFGSLEITYQFFRKSN